jgi:hypothetical protein
MDETLCIASPLRCMPHSSVQCSILPSFVLGRQERSVRNLEKPKVCLPPNPLDWSGICCPSSVTWRELFLLPDLWLSS